MHAVSNHTKYLSISSIKLLEQCLYFY